uniref:Uncharacterized protein n=1 Tax=Pipistrellus kuhlii TaxID=59472 RepID=A0A7J7X148_PIPKU|nr:hypothetical protein mPipKuh1_010813 [Pipistrellus kuhlii]
MEKHLNPSRYMVPGHPDRAPCTSSGPGRRSGWEGCCPRGGRGCPPGVPSPGEGAPAGSQGAGQGVLSSHPGDLSDTPDLVSAVGTPGPERAQNSWLAPHPPRQATGRGGVVESASALCCFFCVSGFPC